MKGNFKIAVLMTCHNRREKTLNCINALFNADMPQSCTLEIFLVDDGSTDGTGDAVKLNFPEINLIKGNGKLYWNQGMRLAWKTAVQKKAYDFYLWLNDDTILYSDAIIELFECYFETLKKDNDESLITGACESFKGSNNFSYGGRLKSGPVIPNGKLMECKYINGNLVIIPKKLFLKLGLLSPEYTHTMGDYDYGLRTILNGYKCYTTRKFIATCPKNSGIPDWCNPKLSIKDRWIHFHSPKGLNIKEYKKFRKKFWRYKWIIFITQAYAKFLFPKLYSIILKKYQNKIYT